MGGILPVSMLPPPRSLQGKPPRQGFSSHGRHNGRRCMPPPHGMPSDFSSQPRRVHHMRGCYQRHPVRTSAGGQSSAGRMHERRTHM